MAFTPVLLYHSHQIAFRISGPSWLTCSAIESAQLTFQSLRRSLRKAVTSFIAGFPEHWNHQIPKRKAGAVQAASRISQRDT
jgi:hypothetical protein